MLKNLTLTNFKSWRELRDVRFAPITTFFGTNSSGKSSILQSLLLLKQTAASSDRARVLHLGDKKSPVQLGTYRDVVFGHSRRRALGMGMTWKLTKELEIPAPENPTELLFSAGEMGFEVSIHEDARTRMVIDHMAYSLNGSRFELKRKGGDSEGYSLSAESGSFQFKRVQGRPWDPPGPLKFYGFPDQVKAYYKNADFLSDLELELDKFLRGIYYLGPLREFPQREYLWSGSAPEDVGQRGERAVEALLASRLQEKPINLGRGKGKGKKSLEEWVARWLKELGLISGFELRTVGEDSNLYRVWVRRTSESPEVLITDVGFGISQVLPVLVLCYYVPRGSVVILEQPEIHLHPSVQAGLADVLIDATRRWDIQVIVESHSEHLLKRLQRRIAEEELSPGETAIYFTTNSGEASKLDSLLLDPYGNIENWPSGFFGDQFGEMVAMTEAMLRRKGVAAG